MGGRRTTRASSSSSSIDSSKPAATAAPPLPTNKMMMINNDLSTDLRLGLSISSSSTNPSSCSNMLIRNSTRVVEEEAMDENCIGNYIDQQQHQRTTLFVKVYMEGIPIGRKLDLHAHHSYHGLITTLTRMFRTTILYGRLPSDEEHVLTYEDKDGDLMMVGDVPWEVFLTSVKRLRITRRDKC